MILYLDTSSLVKLYVEEQGSQVVEELVKISEVTATSLVAYAEARAAFARRNREGAFTPEEYGRLTAFFNQDWDNYLIIRLTNEVVRLAGDLSEKHALRGFDAIHLSSALTLGKSISSPVFFSCFDRRLQEASLIEELAQPEVSR